MGENGKDSGVGDKRQTQIWSDRWSKDEGLKSSFCLTYGHLSLKNAELETKHQLYKGRVVLRGDIVKEDSGSYAVFSKQGSSASQMTAAKVMDIISRLPGCAGQAADAVSAYTQVKMEDAPKFLKFSKIGMSRHLDSSTTTQVALIMVQYGRSSRSSWKESVWSSFGRTVMEKTIWENPIATRFGEGFPIGNASSYTVKRLFFIGVCGWHKLAGKRQYQSDVESTQKNLIWENQHLSWIMFTWGVLKDKFEISKDIVENYRAMFELRISAGGTEKIPYSENCCISSWSYDMEGHAKNCVERYCELANKTTQQLYKYLLHALMTIISKKKNWNP